MKKLPKADLHVHSLFSNDDGADPEDIIIAAKDNGLNYLSFTDYTTLGFSEKLGGRYRNYENLIVLSGVEIMCQGYWELLVYGFECDSPLAKRLKQFNADHNLIMHVCFKFRGQAERNRLRRAISAYDLGQLDLGDRDVRRAWEDVEVSRLTIEEAIKLAADSGALSFLAHPVSIWDLVFDQQFDQMWDRIRELSDVGMSGIELSHPRVLEAQEFHSALLRHTEEFGMLSSGGSEFHGTLREYDQWAKMGNACLEETAQRATWLRDMCKN